MQIYSWIVCTWKADKTTTMDFKRKIKKQKENNTMSRETYNYKRYAIKAAKDLMYPTEIVEKLQNATTEGEIEHIMISARKEIL